MHARTTHIHKCYGINLIYRTTHFLHGPEENGTHDDIRASEAVCESEPKKKKQKYRQIIFKLLFIFSIRLFSLCARSKKMNEIDFPYITTTTGAVT